MPNSTRLDHLRAKLQSIGVEVDNVIIGSIPRLGMNEMGEEVKLPSEALVTISLFLPSQFAPQSGAIAEDILDITHAVLTQRT